MSRNRKKFERLLLSSVSNLAMSFADAYIEKNVERRASAGLKVTVIRSSKSNKKNIYWESYKVCE